VETPEALEQQLLDDLRSLGPRLDDDRFAGDLYRALTRTRWSRFDRDGSVSLGFDRAAELLNWLREERGGEALELEQTGGEGEVSHRLDDGLRELGWRVDDLDTTTNDDRHLGEPAGEPHTEPQDTLADAHREADERPPVPRQGTPGR
jgi:hypothetical protein